MLPFFQNPLGRKIIVPRADHAIRWAMQPGAPASRNRASAASSSTHPRPLCGLPEKGSPFLRLIQLPPFCCAGPSYAPQAPIVQPARLWYNKISKSTVQGERFYADHHTAGHCGYHATAGPGTLGGVCCLRRHCGEGTQAAARRAGVNLMRADAICLTHYHGDHIFGLPGLLQTLGAQGRTRPLALLGPEGLPDLWAAVRALTGPLPYPVKPQVLMPGQPLALDALSEDGVIEAYEYGDRVLATQWHPERLLDEGMLPIWQWFIRRCNAKKEGDSL